MRGGVRNEEGTGDEEDLESEHVGHVDDSQDTNSHQSDPKWKQQYPVIRFSVFIITAMFFTPMG